MASLTGQLVAETYRALLKLIDNDILTASEKQITDGFGGGSNVFIDSQGFLRANKYKVTNGLATQFLKADGSLDSNAYLTSITGAQVITALGYTPVPTTRTITINGETHDLSANNSWTIAGTSAVWGNITGTLSNQTDLQNALNAKFNNPTGTTAQYIRGDGTLATLPSAAVWGNITGTLANQTDLQSALNAKQNALSGTGFVKISGTTISYDNSTYLSAADAASTYQRLDKMVSNLLPSATEYPNSNAVIAALALKADALNPVFTGYMTISGAEPKLYFTDTDQNPDYFIGADAGFFRIYDQTAGATRFVINSSGVTTIAGDLIVGTIAKSGGTASQFLKADGSIDSNSYVTSASLANYLLISTAASTYQRLDKMVSNLLPSSTEYPNSQAVINALALKADAANPVFTGNMTISGAEPKLYFVDTDQNPDYTVFIDSGYFYIYDQTAGATRFSINSSGNINTGVGKSITAGSFIKESGTASQFLMADGSVTTFAGVTGSGTTNYLPKWTSASALGNSILTESASGIGIGIASANGNLQFSNATNSRKIVLYEGANNNFEFYGFGINSSTLVYSVYSLTDDHVFFAGASPTSRNELLRIKGNGNALIAGTLNVKNSSTSGGLSAAVSATGEFMSTGSLAGYFWENRSGGVTTNSNWYGWYTTSGAVKLYNGSTNLLSIDGSSGASSFEGNVTSKLYLGVSRDGSDTIGGGAYLVLSASSTSRQWIQQLTASNNMTYYHYNGSAWIQPISFMASGNILIGTVTDSGYKLDVNGSLRINGVNPSITTDSATDYTIINARKNGTRTWQIDSVGGAYWLYMQGLGAYAMQIASSTGYVGLGTSNPTGTLHIYNSNPAFRIQNSLGGNLQFGQWDSVNNRIEGSGGPEMLITNYSAAIKFGISGSENMRLNTSGHFLIGQTVASGSTNGIYFRPGIESGFIVTNDVALQLSRFGSTGDLLTFYTASTRVGKIVVGGSFVSLESANNGGLNVSSAGNVLIGTTTDSGAKFRVHYDGGNGSAGLNSYNILATTPSTSSTYQATIGAIHPGDGYGNLNLGGNGVFWHISKRLSTEGHQLEFYYYNGSSFASRFIFSTSGNLTATAFFESSDMRLKKLIEHNPIVAGIENLEAKLYEKEGKIEIGYFAQDAELIMPYAVQKATDGFLNLSYREIHTAKIARLEKEVAQLKAQLNLN